MVKNPPANAGDRGSIPGLARSTGERNGNLLQYSCLGNTLNRGAYWATVRIGSQRVGHDWACIHVVQYRSASTQPIVHLKLTEYSVSVISPLIRKNERCMDWKWWRKMNYGFHSERVFEKMYYQTDIGFYYRKFILESYTSSYKYLYFYGKVSSLRNLRHGSVLEGLWIFFLILFYF